MKKLLALLFVSIFLIGIVSAFDWFDGSVVSYYNFDQTTGVHANDTLGRNNGTIYGSVTKGVPGKINTSYYYDGAGDSVNVSTSDSLNFGNNSFSIAFWFNSTGNNQVVVGKRWLTNSPYWLIITDGTGKLRFVTNPIDDDVISTTTVTDGVIRYAVAIRNNQSNRLLMYINGVLEGNDSATIVNVSNNGSMIFGDVDGASVFLQGITDEVGIWNRSLTQAEITELYNTGSGLSYGTTLKPDVNLTFPSNTANLTSSTSYLNASYNATLSGSQLTNATYYLWFNNGTPYNITHTRIITGLTNTTQELFTLAIGNYYWNVFACLGDGVGINCSYANSNNSFNYNAFNINQESFVSSVSEGTTQTFWINTTLSSGFNFANATLVYNNTNYPGSITSLGGFDYNISRAISVPSLTSSTNFTFYWNVTLSNGQSYNTTFRNQTVAPVFIDNCGVFTSRILNYTVYDEDTRLILNPPTYNTTIEAYVRLSDVQGNVYTYFVNQTNANNLSVCVSPAISSATYLSSDVKYYSTDHVIEYHLLENVTINSTLIPLNYSLYDLAINSSQEFLVNVKDANFLPLSGALITLTRQYLSIGQFLPVEIMRTDSDGNTVGHFVLNDEIYTIYVSVNGTLVATFNNQKAFCSNVATGDCRINLNILSSTINPSDFNNYLGISSIEDYNDTSKKYTFLFSTNDGLPKTILVNISKYDNFGNTSICSTTLTSSSGTLTCIIPAQYYNNTAMVKVYVDGQLYSTALFDISISKSALVNSSRYLLAFLLLVTLPLLGIASGPLTIVLFIVGLITAVGLSLIDTGGLLGTLSAVGWFVIAGGVLIWKATKRREN